MRAPSHPLRELSLAPLVPPNSSSRTRVRTTAATPTLALVRSTRQELHTNYRPRVRVARSVRQKKQYETKPEGTHHDRECATCPDGNWCDGSATVTPCARGKFQDGETHADLSKCYDCAKGQYAGGTGWHTCRSARRASSRRWRDSPAAANATRATTAMSRASSTASRAQRARTRTSAVSLAANSVIRGNTRTLWAPQGASTALRVLMLRTRAPSRAQDAPQSSGKM